MIKSFLPQPRIYFTGCICNAARTFPDCYKLDHHSLQPQDAEDPLLPLHTRDGTFHLPSIVPQEDVRAFAIHSFSLNISMEHMAYSLSPYSVWDPIQTHQGFMTFPDNSSSSTLHSLPSITNPPPDTFPFQPVRNHVSFAPYKNQQTHQRLRPQTHLPFRPPRPQNQQLCDRPRPWIDQTSQQSLTPGTSQAQNSGHQAPHHSTLQTPQHQFAVFQPGVPPTLSQLLTPRAPCPVYQAHLHEPEDDYEDDKIEDF